MPQRRGPAGSAPADVGQNGPVMGAGRASARLVRVVVVFGALGGLLVMHGLSVGHQAMLLPVAHASAAGMPVGGHHAHDTGLAPGGGFSAGVAGAMVVGAVAAGAECPACAHEGACVAVLRPAVASAVSVSVVAVLDPAGWLLSSLPGAVVGRPWRGPPRVASLPELCISRT